MVQDLRFSRWEMQTVVFWDVKQCDLIYTKNRSNSFLSNVGIFIPELTLSHPRKQNSSNDNACWPWIAHLYLCIRTTWSEMMRSCSPSTKSSITNNKSKRDNKESCRPIFSIGVLYWSYWNREQDTEITWSFHTEPCQAACKVSRCNEYPTYCKLSQFLSTGTLYYMPDTDCTLSWTDDRETNIMTAEHVICPR